MYVKWKGVWREREREREREEWTTDSRGTVLALLFLGAFLRTEEGISGMGTLLPVIAEMMAVMNPPIMTVNSVAMTWAMPSAMTSAMASITAVSTVTAKMYTTTRRERYAGSFSSSQFLTPAHIHESKCTYTCRKGEFPSDKKAFWPTNPSYMYQSCMYVGTYLYMYNVCGFAFCWD